MSLLLETPEGTEGSYEDSPVTMSSLLEMPEIRARLFPVSVEAYHFLTDDQRTELLRGVIIKKVSKSPKHRAKGLRIYKILAAQITPEFQIFPEGPVTLADSEPEPDVAVVRGTEAEFDEKHPSTAELVVEVAVTSLRLDRAKAPIYAEAGIKEYWIVRPETKQVEVYRQPTPTGYTETLTVSSPAVLQPVALPGVSVDLAELFA